MTRSRRIRILFALIMAVALILPGTVAYAATGPATPPPVAIKGPRLSPPAIPHSSVLNPYTIYNNLLVPPGLPQASVEANAADGGRTQEKPGRGIRQTSTGIGFGLLLYESPNVCNDFNPGDQWAAKNAVSDVWTDWFAGWAPFAIDNGLYQAKNVTFSMERSVGPGNRYGANEHSAKIASNQPYAAGFGSPLIKVPAGYAGGKVMVSVKYLIWDHDTGGKQGGPDGFDYDWASLGVKPDAYGDSAYYVNGYVRGEWAELTNTVDLGDSEYIMVLLQGQSPGAFNSNIYFDDVKIAFIDANGNGKYLKDCKLEESVK
ncbi:hypothetical protein FKZ61_006870 [Litorilinea aerophila]|uniref:Uncharacterized protein n=1 Tax=Litorilinea aerophila TaxID=1204385 RepID=A0A540VIL3_9CHLR|nr:hypothetical protein [Litorilinea aerophila]MCC9075829.1 hypothetical protein [Litorilinea aerophila]